MRALKNIKPIAKGLTTFVIPPDLLKRGGEETADADYCYSVLMRHAVMLRKHGFDPFQGTIAELGPGASLGVGIGALMMGAENYIGLDLIDYDCWDSNARIFDALLPFLQNKRDIPAGSHLKNTKPVLDSYDFPDGLFDEALLTSERLQKLRAEISAPGGRIRYAAPWMKDTKIKPGSIHWIFSQAVLEHVDDLEGTYSQFAESLTPGGCISHQIDFKSHGFAAEVNGHWAYSKEMWKIVRGGRKYAINRAPASAHIKLAEKYGLKILEVQTTPMEGGLPANQLAEPFRSMPQDDLNASGLFFIAQKPTT